MVHYDLLEILALGFGLALGLGYAAHRIGLSPIVGYLLAGFLLGPRCPGVNADVELAQELSEAGVILLMFGVGLHFHVKDLLAVKGVAVPGALIQSAAATLCGLLVAHIFGMGTAAGLILGLGLSVASTVVLLRVLTDHQLLDTVQGHVAVGWLVVEDILTVLVLVLLPSLAVLEAGTGAAGPGAMAWAFGGAIVRLALLWVIVLVVGGKVVPWFLTRILRTRSQELFILAVLTAAFATAVGAAYFFQASLALGAFLGGMVIGRTEISHQAGADVLPLRDAFAVLFFIAVGMLFDPSYIADNPWLILCCLGIILVVKPLVGMAAVALLGYSAATSLTVAAGLAQVGEFSFILAQQARSSGLLKDNGVYSALVICAFVSISLNPLLFGWLPRLAVRLRRHPRLWKLLNHRADQRARRDSQRRRAATPAASERQAEGDFAVIVGYGPAGRGVADALRRRGLIPVIVDMNVDTVNALNDEGHCAVYGNATKKEVLKGAGIAKAKYLVLTIPDLKQTIAAAAAARELHPEIEVLARARFLTDAEALAHAGVSHTAFEEEAVAAALAALIPGGDASGVPFRTAPAVHG